MPGRAEKQLTLAPVWDRPRVLRMDELIEIFAPDDPDVISGRHNIYGFTPSEWRAYQRKVYDGR